MAIQALVKEGFPIHKDVLNRDITQPYEEDATVEAAWLEVYADVKKYWNLYQLAEKLIDIEDWLQQWRFRHMKTVERIIGHKMGTGGSSGVSYLKRVLIDVSSQSFGMFARNYKTNLSVHYWQVCFYLNTSMF